MKKVRILVLSFLFKWESFSFVRGLWLLDLNNIKLLLWIFSWISFAYDVLRWWLESLLLPSIREIAMRSIFFRDHCLVYRRMTSAWAFLQGDFNSLGLSSFFIRGFSLVSLWSMIFSCYFSVDFVFFSWHSKSDIVDVCLCRREGALVTWSKTLGLEITQVFSNWSR